MLFFVVFYDFTGFGTVGLGPWEIMMGILTDDD